MTKSEFRRRRLEHWQSRTVAAVPLSNIDRDVEAAEAAGVKWEREPFELPAKLYYRGGHIANYCEGSQLGVVDHHIYANANSVAFQTDPLALAATLDAVCKVYNAWGPGGLLRDSLAAAVQGHVKISDQWFKMLLAEPWKSI